MSTLAAVTLYGNFAIPRLTAKRITRKRDDLDAGTLTYVCNIEEYFTPGQSAPGYPGLIIDYIDSVASGGGVWEHTLTVYGKAGGKGAFQVRGFPSPSYNLMDWDTVEDEWITTNRNQFVEGQLGAYGGTTICVSRSPKPLGAGWYRVTGKFQGIITPKPRQRTITCDSQSISGDKIAVLLPGGWNVTTKGEVDIPEVVVEDEYFTNTPPPTQLIPGFNVPPDAPQINVAIGTQAAFVTEGPPTRHWPYGWKLDSVSGVPIADRGLWKVKLRYKYAWAFTP